MEKEKQLFFSLTHTQVIIVYIHIYVGFRHFYFWNEQDNSRTPYKHVLQLDTLQDQSHPSRNHRGLQVGNILHTNESTSTPSRKGRGKAPTSWEGLPPFQVIQDTFETFSSPWQEKYLLE